MSLGGHRHVGDKVFAAASHGSHDRDQVGLLLSRELEASPLLRWRACVAADDISGSQIYVTIFERRPRCVVRLLRDRLPGSLSMSLTAPSRRSCGDIAAGYEFDGRAVEATLALVEAHLSQSCGCRVPPQFLGRKVEDVTVHCE